jgi:CRISPR/Cas system CMR-associated protein Cmr1 (group 7 of RAMP superfamily)
MITADTLKRLSTLDHVTLSGLVLDDSAKRKIKFTGATFLGITNGGEFCYSVVYRSKDFEGTDSTKVFVKNSPSSARVSATSELTNW